MVIELLKSRARKISDIAENSAYFFSDPTEYDPAAAKKYFTPEAADVLRKLLKRLESISRIHP